MGMDRGQVDRSITGRGFQKVPNYYGYSLGNITCFQQGWMLMKHSSHSCTLCAREPHAPWEGGCVISITNTTATVIAGYSVRTSIISAPGSPDLAVLCGGCKTPPIRTHPCTLLFQKVVLQSLCFSSRALYCDRSNSIRFVLPGLTGFHASSPSRVHRTTALKDC